jgi:glycosyltransferase involved in cell wall biosynthesis
MFIQQNKKHILIVNHSKIPALKYGGTERVIWDLGKTLVDKGYRVSYLVSPGSYCAFADVIFYNSKIAINSQIPDDVDLVHFNFNPIEEIKKPYLVTVHGNPSFGDLLNIQSVFVSKNHAERYGSTAFVYNGLDWNNYPKVNLAEPRNHFHFLANAAWRVKNVKGAISICKKAHQQLTVLGGHRFNIKMGLRVTFDTHVQFKGMVDNEQKAKYLAQSKGLIFPVLWHEPFGLAIIESLYFGCPIFATPYGSLNELVNKDIGFLSNSADELALALLNADDYYKNLCHDFAVENFSAEVMTNAYIQYYEKVLNGEKLNKEAPTLIEQTTQKFLPYS